MGCQYYTMKQQNTRAYNQSQLLINSRPMSAHEPRSYTNNISGNLNRKNQHKYKQIDLEDLDVEMISPHFLQNKTLKKPLKEYGITLDKTNPQGVSSYAYQRDVPTQDHHSSVNFQKEQQKVQQKKVSTFSVLDASELNIKPAYRPSTQESTFVSTSTSNEISLPKDNNTIFSALMKKGIKPQVAIKPEKAMPKEDKKVGPAEAKLKALMGRKEPNIDVSGPKVSFKKKENKHKQEVEEEIAEQFDDYGNQSFQKLSAAYESAIRQSIAGDSNFKESVIGESIIKQSIRQSIMESIQAGASTSKIKESIRQDIAGGSSRSLKEEIIEEISVSKGKSKESIEEIYQEVFEDIADSNSLSKSRSGFKKSYNQKQLDSLSQSQSKGFRMKTNVVKSLKYAEELVKKQKESLAPKKIDDPVLNQEIAKQKINLKRLQENIGKFMAKENNTDQLQNKNSDLYFNFKKQLNRLITSQNFESKLKKLASFLTISPDIAPDNKKINQLEDGILKNVMTQVQNIRVGQHHLDEVEKIKKDYEHKLKEQLLVQEVKLRAEMNQKLSDKDFQLKKMIAELQSRMMSRSFHRGGKSEGYAPQRPQQFEVESDYSIDSDNVSWKADLWELLPEYEKKKLYDKQSAQVTKFLADIMVSQLQEEALDRSLDISFEFPEEYNNIPVNTYNTYTISEKSYESSSNYSETPVQTKSNAFKKEESKQGGDFLSDLPKLNLKRSHTSESSNSSQRMEELKSERVKRDQKLKPEIIKILSQYKNLYLRKKQDAVRNLLKVLTSKDNDTKKYMLNSIQNLSILSERQFRKDHKMYIKAYEEELFMNLVGIYNRSLNKRQSAIEQQMKGMYDRLVVVCQVSIAQKCTERVALDAQKNMKYNVEVLTGEAIRQMEQHPCLLEVPTHENYMELKTKMEEKQIKGELVQHIVNILSTEFAKEFPKKKK